MKSMGVGRTISLSAALLQLASFAFASPAMPIATKPVVVEALGTMADDHELSPSVEAQAHAVIAELTAETRARLVEQVRLSVRDQIAASTKPE